MQEGRLKEIKLGFIGAGAMGGALMRGLVAAGVPPAHLTFYDPDPQRRQDLETLGIAPARDNPEVMQFPVVVLAVKPQVIDQALGEIQGSAREQHLIISIAAGVPLSRLEAALPQARLIRAMPNTPLLVQEGMTGLAPGSRARPEDLSLALELFGTVGRAVVVEDKLLDAVTALSASGVGFAAIFLEALADGGVRLGLPRALALEMAAQTLVGAGRLCLAESLHPAAMKDAVASPGGTTIAGLHALEQGGLRGVVMDAVLAAALRAKEMAGASGK
ncbi:MAG: pyrroline-5-carboxylate reductase [Deltaproteobacteria bacterium]|nr:pyrroline-5-carboxylate reductase [Deltaproteobacteria bacterium]